MQSHDAVQSSDRSPVGDLLVQRLRGVGNGLASCGVRDGGLIAWLFVFVDRPAETVTDRKIGFNPDRERVILGHFNNMGPWWTVFQHAIWLSISN
jgi:hypothetical protein